MSEAKKLRKRLEMLNRGPLRAGKGAKSKVDELRREIDRLHIFRPARQPRALVYPRGLPGPRPKPLPRRATGGECVVLERAVEGMATDSPHGTQAYVISQNILTGDGKLSPLNEAYRDAVARKDSSFREWLWDVCEADDVGPGDVIMFDLETTGLSSTPVFLVGAMSWEGDRLVARQFLARNYAEEPAILSMFLEWAATKKLLVSFNGKSFDLPYVRVRAAANGIPFELDMPHFDLLHVSRRAWRDEVPNHKLQTLETHLCGRYRTDDIPGSEIPKAYHDYVRTSNAVEIVEVLRHNLLDLVTLADLMVRLPLPG